MKRFHIPALGLFVGLVGCSSDSVDATSDDVVGEYQPGCEEGESASYALGGTILTPKGPVKGWVVVKDQKIHSIAKTKSKIPSGAKIVETKGVISPGLIDLHNHVTYNFLPLWDSGKRWKNRYEWQMDAGYIKDIQTPFKAVKTKKHMCEAIKFGEYKALVGGTTTIEDSDDLPCTRSWARNVEFTNFCEDHVEERVGAIAKMAPNAAAKLNEQLESEEIKAFLVHLSEGIDASSKKEFEELRAFDLIKPQVATIHGVALDAEQLGEMGEVGMKLIWSPLSNMILYGKTADIPTAVESGVIVSLAPDWSPSGSSNLLGELKVADRINQEQFGGVLTDQQLWEMATANPADTVAWTDKVGRITAGLFADLLVVRGDVANPYRAIIDAAPQDVLLTTVSGEPFYGDPTILDALGAEETYETVDACGEERGLVTTDANDAIPGSDQDLETVTSVFKADGVKKVASLFQCEGAPEFAFEE